MATVVMSAKEIKTLRLSLGLTQEAFAESLGVQRTAVTLWENNLRQPSGAACILIEQLREKAAKHSRK